MECKKAYIIDPLKINADFNKNNIHLMGYSIPINKKLNLNQLKKRFFFKKHQRYSLRNLIL